MNRMATTAAALLLAAPALGQTLPAPQFAYPAPTDSSNQAATTAWVRALGLQGGSGDMSASTVLIPGSTVPRTLAARAATVFNVLDYGAKPDGTTDIGPVLNTIAGLLVSNSANVIYIPAGNYALKSAVTFTGVAPIIQGQGYTAGPAPTSGTTLTISGTGYVPITFSGTNARGAVVRDIGIDEVQPATGPGWQPTAYGYVFQVLNALGEITFENVYFAGVTRGIYADNSGRLNVINVAGQFYTAGIEIDNCYDIPRIEHLHAWTYQSSDPSVVSWQEANEDTLILRRVDGIFIDNLFTLGARSAIHLTSGANGVTTKFYVNDLYADFVKYGVWIDANGVNGQISNATTQNNDQTAPANPIPGSRGLYVTGNTVGLQVGNWRTNITAGSAIDLEGFGANIMIGTLWANTYGVPGAGTPAVTNVNTAGNPGNSVQVNHSWLQGVSPLYLFTPSNGGQEQPVLMNAAGNDANSIRAYSVASGAAPSLQAIGSDAAIDLSLGAKSIAGSVRLQSNGQTVLRADDANAGVDDLLLRGGTGTMNLVAEGGDANVDEYLTSKGPSGGVRMQANGLVAFRTDNPNSGDSDLLVRPGSGAVNLVVESLSAGADIDIAGKGSSGGVRLQANGTTSLRTDNPNAVSDDMLVRPGQGTISLIAEGSDANVNLVLAPKGIGSVVVPTMAATDNSTNAASTAFVASVVPGLVPVHSVAGRSGAITLAVADVTGAAPLAAAALTGTTTVSTRSGGSFTVTGTQPGGTGFANSAVYLLVAKTASTAAARLTTDGSPPSGSNCVNPAANSADNLFVEVVGIDTASAGNVARYRLLDLLLYRGATAAATQLVNGASAAPPNGSIGAGSTATFTATADTTNGCLALSVTAPNADAWHWAARVLSTEVQ